MDEETKNLFMNITGTIVVKETTKNGQVEKSVQVYPPMYKKALELLRFGGSMAKAYTIDKNGIDVNISESLTIAPENSWKTRIFKMLKNIQEKILSENKERNQTLSNDERTLISTTHFPMGSLLSLMTQYNGKGSIISIDRYSDLIAFERVLKFAEDISRDTLNKAEALRSAQVNGYELDEYIKQIHDVLKDLQALNMENYQKMSVEQQTIDYLINMDRHLREKERGV
jgi:predicted transcriptional regulator with HTH domain